MSSDVRVQPRTEALTHEPTEEPNPRPGRIPTAVTALSIGAFGIGATEFTPIGLLPQIADGTGVSVPTAGWVVTGYALGVMLGAPIMTVLGVRFDRRTTLAVLMGLFVLGNVLSALAPSFAVLLVGRAIASLTHGAFFGIGSVVAAQLAGPGRAAGAIARMFTGLTVANLLGVPAGTWIGQHFGWHATFAVIAVIGLVAMLAIRTMLPSVPAGEGVRVRAELRSLKNVQVLLAMLMTVLGFGAVFAAITYVAPLVVHVSGFAESDVTWLMIVFGFGLVVGNTVGGRLADKHLMPLLFGAFTLLGLASFAFSRFADSRAFTVAGIFAVGALGFATVPPLQKRVLDVATGAPNLASAINIGAFNLGNAIAAWLGGAVVAAGLGWTAPLWVGALLAAGALAVAVLSAALDRPARRS